MTWTTDATISAQAAVDEPIKGSTIRAVQQNISEAFAGSSGAPSMAGSVAGLAISGLALDSVGMHRTITSTQAGGSYSSGTPPTFPSNLYTPGTSYSAATLGLSSGTWMHIGGGLSGSTHYVDGSSLYVYTGYYTNTFLRIA